MKTIKLITAKLKLILLFVLLLQVKMIAFSQETNSTEQTHRCKVVRIRDVGNAYAITVDFYYNSSEYCTSKVVVSLKTDNKEGVKIKRGRFYDFTFKDIDGYYQLISDFRRFRWNLLIDDIPVSFNNTKHYQMRRFVLSPCIEGLYYKGCDK